MGFFSNNFIYIKIHEFYDNRTLGLPHLTGVLPQSTSWHLTVNNPSEIEKCVIDFFFSNNFMDIKIHEFYDNETLGPPHLTGGLPQSASGSTS